MFGAALNPSAKKVLLLGAGELAKELIFSLQRLGLFCIAVENYPNAPAMQVAHQNFVIDMTNETLLRELIDRLMPDVIIPEIEAIATKVLIDCEKNSIHVAPCAQATDTTMNRQAIRKLAQVNNLPTTKFKFAENLSQVYKAVDYVGLPCVIKPLMSSSGKGQTIIKNTEQIQEAWQHSQSAGRTTSQQVIIEEFLPFDYEITLLTVKQSNEISYCAPIGHRQQDGDYQLSWQPHPCKQSVLDQAHSIASSIVTALGGSGIFGVELFVADDRVYFNEVSPRPHDTGLVTLLSQNLSQFDLHIRAILDLPIPKIETLRFSASRAITMVGESSDPKIDGVKQALSIPNTDIRLFSKPNIHGKRRLGVILASAPSLDLACQHATQAFEALELIE